jgi:hypothetical protein
MKKLVLILMLISNPLIANTQLSNSEVKKLENIIFEEIKRENYLKLNRITKSGKLSSCELEFGYAYRDNRALEGKPVYISGSVSIIGDYAKKNVFALLKIVPSVSDVRNQKWIQTYPQYLSMKINNESLDKFQYTDFRCGSEGNGRCIGYGDNKFEMLQLIAKAQPFDSSITFSLSKGGYDNNFSLSALSATQESLKIRNNFFMCSAEIMEEIFQELKLKK